MKYPVKINYRVFSICLILSAISWLGFNLPQQYAFEIKVPVEYSGFFENKIRLKPVPNIIKVNLKGNGFDFIFFQLSRQKPKLLINFNELHTWDPSTYSCQLPLKDLIGELPFRRLHPSKIYPETLALQGEPLESKIVPIKLNAALRFEKTYQQHGNYTLSPAKVEVFGTAQELAQIHQVETRKETLSNISKTNQYTFQLIPPIANQKCLVQNTTRLTLPVSQFTEASIELPITSSNIHDKKIKFFPDKITVKYMVALSDYKKVVADSFMVETQPIPNQSHKRNVIITRKSDLIKISTISPETVEYIIFE